MKKITLCLVLLMGLVTFSSAQTDLEFLMNAGILTDTFKFENMCWSIGAEADFHVGSLLVLAPEINLYGYKFAFKKFMLVPGAKADLVFSQVFVGVGFITGIELGNDPADLPQAFPDEAALKLNAGFITNSLKITAYVITDFKDFMSKFTMGAMVGFHL